MKNAIYFFIFLSAVLKAQTKIVQGKIIDLETGKALSSVIIKSDEQNTVSNHKGEYSIVLSKQKKQIQFILSGYKTVYKSISIDKDTITMNIKMELKSIDLNLVTVSDNKKVDTVFGTWKFGVADYEFYENKLILLTFEYGAKKEKIVLVETSQKILSSFQLPEKAEKLYKDYLGFINVICEQTIFRITVDNNNTIHLGALPTNEYKQRIMPCIDTINQNIYFSNYQRDYPEFTYYAFNTADTTYAPLKRIYDKDALDSYNMEYYFLNTRDKLTARQLAQEYKMDYHRVAAIMSGVTNSMFYTPLYAPLFIINDTVCIFDHYSNAILKYNNKNELIDSVNISYHHPKNWKEWKHKLIADETTKEIYALYQKNGFYYLKQIDLQSGKVISSFKLSNQYVDKIKIKNGSVYYVYRPFESLQQRFVYKELISKN